MDATMTSKKEKGSPSSLWSFFSGSLWINKAPSGTIHAENSRRSHRRQRTQLDDTLQFGTPFFLCLKRRKCWMQKQQWTRHGRSWRRFRLGRWLKLRAKRRWFWKHTKINGKSSLLHWRTCAISKKAEPERNHRKTTSRTSRWHFFWKKNNSSAHAVLTEQGSSASQMSAAKLRDVIARLPDCDGQAADAVSAWTQVKLEDAPRILSIPKSERPDIRIRLPRHKWTKSWSNIEDPVVPFERNLWSPTRRPSVGKTIRGSFVGAWMAKSTELGRSICASETWIILIGIRGWHQYGWKRSRIWLPMWKKQMQNVGLHSRTFLDHVIWDVLNENANRTKLFWAIKRNVSKTSYCWSNWKISEMGKVSRKDGCVVSRHGRTCSKIRWEIRYWELANKKDTATSLKSLLGRWSVPKGGAWIDWRMIQSVLTNYKLSWNTGIWRELVDLTFCGQWMNLLDQSPNWHDLMPDVWQD